MKTTENPRAIIRRLSFAALFFTLALPHAVQAAGALDSSFGSGGKVTTPIGTSDDLAYALVSQPDGKLVAAGYTSGTTFDFALARYNSDGSLDSTFGTGGKVTTPIGASSDEAHALILQPDGKLVAAGYTSNGSTYDFALVRYTSAGSLDSTFGTGGKVTTPIGTSNDQAYALVLQPDGRLVAAGYGSAVPVSVDRASLGLDTGLVSRVCDRPRRVRLVVNATNPGRGDGFGTPRVHFRPRRQWV